MLYADGHFNVSRVHAGCVYNPCSAMIRKIMFRNIIGIGTLLTAGLLIGCGTSSTGPEGGSKHQAETGVSVSGYPAGEPKDAGSPALASSTESQYSRDQTEKGETSKGSESSNKQ